MLRIRRRRVDSRMTVQTVLLELPCAEHSIVGRSVAMNFVETVAVEAAGELRRLEVNVGYSHLVLLHVHSRVAAVAGGRNVDREVRRVAGRATVLGAHAVCARGED